MSQQHDDKHNHGHHEHYVAPISMLVKIFVALIILTGLTVLTSMFDFGIMNIVIAMFIAVIKASLVVLFFMQLKVDRIENRVSFVAAFAFLFIFIMLTGSDLFFRHHQEPLKIESKTEESTPADQNKFRMVTPVLVAKGKELFSNQCVSCHGPEGKGNGEASVGMNPPPRNFTTGYWRYGGAPTQIFHTLTNGSPGTNMASYANLSTEDRYALVHYVRSLSPNHPEDDSKTLSVAGLLGGSTAQAAEGPKEQIPVDMAMDHMEAPDQVILPQDQEIEPESAGAKLFMKDCASCHGMNGSGGVAMSLGQNPRVDLMTQALTQLQFDSQTHHLKPWASNSKEFMNVVARGLPGRGMPGMANYSDREWADLYTYVKKITK